MARFYFTLAFILIGPASAFGAEGTSLEALQRYAEMSDSEIKNRCAANLGAVVDASNVESDAETTYLSACARIYEKAKASAEGYFKLLADSTVDLTKANRAAECGAYRNPTSQKTCFTDAIDNVKRARVAQEKLKEKLEKSSKWVQRYMAYNERVLARYQLDQQVISKALADAKHESDLLTAQGNHRAADRAYASKASAKQAAGVAAVDGAASDISSYERKIPDLVREQSKAIEEGQNFSSSAATRAQQHARQASEFASMEKQLTSQVSRLAPDSVDDNKKVTNAKPLPETAPKPLERPGGGAIAGKQSQTGVAGRPSGGQSNSADGLAAAPRSNFQTGNLDGGGATSGGSVGGGNYGQAAAGALGAAGAGSGMSGNPVGSSAYPELPTVAETGTQTKNEQANTPKSYNLGGSSPQTGAVEEGSSEGAVAKDETRIDDGAFTGEAGVSGDQKSESTAASSAPGKREGGGKATGFSASSGGAWGAGGRVEKEVATKEQFLPNLTGGAVSIAGSDLKSAMSSLAEELGTNLDLGLGDLGEEEKAALMPIEGEKTMAYGSGPGAGRKTASLIQGSDESILDEQSLALFSRARTAHERAVKRGNLILGIKKKF